jgi:hypothetical protein
MLNITTLAQKPELEGQVDALTNEAWPEFLHHGNMHHWGDLFTTYAAYQILVCGEDGELMAVGHTIPLSWDGTIEDLPEDMNSIMERALQAGTRVNTLSALAAMVWKRHQGSGLSRSLIQEMKRLVVSCGFHALIAPVRPTLKSSYPLTPFEHYTAWQAPKGGPFDPWMRLHWRLGAQIVRMMPQALVVDGSLTQWETWTGMRFPESGDYVVQGALQPVTIDVENGTGRYLDPNVWMVNRIGKYEHPRDL